MRTGAPGAALRHRPGRAAGVPRLGAGDALETGAYSIACPQPRAPVLTPDLVLVPLLAFDHMGRRLGYGGGFYDRTIAALRAAGDVQVVGLAYSAQRLTRVPSAAHDMRLDWIVTEHGALKAGA